MCTNEKISVKNAINSMFELKFSAFFRFNVLQAHLPECSEKFFFGTSSMQVYHKRELLSTVFAKITAQNQTFFLHCFLCKTANIRKNQQYGAFTDTNKPVSRRISLGLPGFKTIYLFPTIPRTTYQCFILLSWR